MASYHAPSYSTATSDGERPSLVARRMILSSMSVMFDTNRTSSPHQPR